MRNVMALRSRSFRKMGTSKWMNQSRQRRVRFVTDLLSIDLQGLLNHFCTQKL
jgi:hypothetical protein